MRMGRLLFQRDYVSPSENLGMTVPCPFKWSFLEGKPRRKRNVSKLERWTSVCVRSMQAYVDDVSCSTDTSLRVRFMSAMFWKGKQDEEERKAWLQNLKEWTWNCHDSAWEKFQMEMQAYVDENGTSLVPSRYVSPSAYKLGMMLSNCPFPWHVLEGKTGRTGAKGVARRLARMEVGREETDRREGRLPLSGTKRGREEE